MHNTLTSLTKREREVLSLLANGEATNELARMLGVRPRTVQKHLQRIYAKLGVKGRTAAALMMVRSGISQE
jgi:DNA-binding CsgD family transcriptional regulator